MTDRVYHESPDGKPPTSKPHDLMGPMSRREASARDAIFAAFKDQDRLLCGLTGVIGLTSKAWTERRQFQAILMLYQLCYWHRKPDYKDRAWIYVTHKAWKEQRNLERRQVWHGTEKLEEMGLLVTRTGQHKRTHFGVSWEKLAELLGVAVDHESLNTNNDGTFENAAEGESLNTNNDGTFINTNNDGISKDTRLRNETTEEESIKDSSSSNGNYRETEEVPAKQTEDDDSLVENDTLPLAYGEGEVNGNGSKGTPTYREIDEVLLTKVREVLDEESGPWPDGANLMRRMWGKIGPLGIMGHMTNAGVKPEGYENRKIAEAVKVVLTEGNESQEVGAVGGDRS